jgi:hypothetical protein
LKSLADRNKLRIISIARNFLSFQIAQQQYVLPDHLYLIQL